MASYYTDSNFVLPCRDDWCDADDANATEVIWLQTSTSECTRNIFGQYATYIYMYGTMPSGRKCAVICSEVPISVLVRVPVDHSLSCNSLSSPSAANGIPNASIPNSGAAEAFMDGLLRPLARDGNYRFRRMEIERLLPFKGFYTEPQPYVRVHFTMSRDRTEFISFVQGRQWELADDDKASDLYNLISRRLGYKTSSWCIARGAKKLTPVEMRQACLYNVSHAWIVPMQTIQGLSDVDIVRLRIGRDKSIVCTWDIETRSKTITGDAPTENEDYTIISIAATVSRAGATFSEDRNNTLCAFCAFLIESDTSQLPCVAQRDIYVHCSCEQRLIEVYIEFLRNIRPDFMNAFRGGDFDWPLLRGKCRRYGLLQRLYDALSVTYG